MGTEARSTAAVRLSSTGAKSSGGRWPVEQSRTGRCVAFQDWAWKSDGADFSAGTAGQARETARSRTGCRARTGGRAGVDREEMGGGEAVIAVAD